MAAEGGPGPEGNEQREERETIGCALLRGNGIQGTYHVRYPGMNDVPVPPGGKRNPAECEAVLFDEARVKEIVDLRRRLDDADLEQQLRGVLVEGEELAREEFLVSGFVLPA
jgi:hypothetical protein